METQIITLFCIIVDFLNVIDFKDDSQAQMSTSEVMLTTIVAAKFFKGNIEITRMFLRDHKYVPKMLSKSRLNRRTHKIDIAIWEALQGFLRKIFNATNFEKEYAMDSFPVPVCKNIRIRRCKIYKEEQYRGFNASNKTYFFGLKVHMICTTKREPIEIIFSPGSISDTTIYKQFEYDIPEGSIAYGDGAYNDYEHEDFLKESADITILAIRKSNMIRQHPKALTSLIHRFRRNIETTFSEITSLFPKSIHAVTAKGFELKLMCFIFAYGLSKLY